MGHPLLSVTGVGLLVILTVATPSAATPSILNLNLISDQSVVNDEVFSTLGLEAGQPVNRHRLREGVHALYAAGDVEQVRVETTRNPDGLDVTVRVSFRPRLAAVNVTANGRWRRRTRDWLELQIGAVITAGDIEAGQRRVERELRERGHTAARVEVWADYQRSDNTVVVTAMVAPGAPERLRKVTVEGVDEPEIASVAVERIRLGGRLSSRNLIRARDRVEAALHRHGFWEAEIVGTTRSVSDGEVTLRLNVDIGDLYRLEIDAPADLTELVEEAFPDPSEEAMHPAQTEALAARVRANLQRRGYLLSDVEAALVTLGDERVMTVHAFPGNRRRVQSIRFEGAESLPAKTLEAAVQVRRGSSHGWRGQEITNETLQDDRLALAEVYRQNGYADVSIGQPRFAEEGKDDVIVIFPVEEGRRWIVTDLQLLGFPLETAAELEERRFDLFETRPWVPSALDDMTRNLGLMLARAGYPDGTVNGEVDTSLPGQARVVLTAEPGDFVTIGAVVIAGLQSVHEGVVRRTIIGAGVEPGAPFSLDAMLTAQTRLYELGLFRRVELVPIPGQERRTVRGVVVRCEEGDHRSYLLGAGWDTTYGPRFTFGWSHLNLFGGAHAISLETRFSDRELRYQISWREARLKRLGVPGYLVVYRTEENFATYSQRRRGLWFEVGDRRRRPFRPFLRYEYQIVRPDAPPEILSDLERQDQEILIASLTPTIAWDYRDDPLVPTSGHVVATSLEYAFPAFQATAHFLKAQGSLSVYRPMRFGVAALGVRLGAIQPLDSTTDDPPNLQIPVATRFFAGGNSTHRAFATDFLGIPGQTLEDDGNPIGGNAMVLINLEVQRAITGQLTAVLFLDGGNVWAEPRKVRWGDLRWGAGLGLRYQTPAGPIRLEYGHKLDRLEGEASGELFLAFGTPF